MAQTVNGQLFCWRTNTEGYHTKGGNNTSVFMTKAYHFPCINYRRGHGKTYYYSQRRTRYVPFSLLLSITFSLHSLDVVIIVGVADHRHESLEPRELVEVLHGVDDVWVGAAAGWRLTGIVVVSQAKTPGEEPLDERQLRPFLLWVPFHGGRHAVKRVPCPDLGCCLGGPLSGGGLHGFVIPEHALACLYTTSIVSAAGVAELMPAPAQVMLSTMIKSSTCIYEWNILQYMRFKAMAICVTTTQNMLHYLKAAEWPNPNMPNTNRILV